MISGDSPNSTRGVEHLIVRARQITLLVITANILHIVEDPLLHSDLDKCRQCRRDQLHQERCAWWYLDVVTELEILDERSGFGECLDGVGLEDHIGERLAGEEGSRDDLSEDVQVDLQKVSSVNNSAVKKKSRYLHPDPSSHR